MTTVPTGFSGVPPPGPAIPVIATATSARVRANPLRHRDRHRLADGAVLRNDVARHVEPRNLRLVLVRDDAAVYVIRAPGHVRQAGQQEAAGARFRSGKRIRAGPQ